MTQFQTTAAPICTKCQEQMRWAAEHIVESKPVEVFHCEVCDKYAATSKTKKSKAAAAP